MTLKKGVPQRLYLMQVATWNRPGALWPTPYPCYLLQTSDGSNILIDSGFPDQLPDRPGMEAHKNVIEQLALLNIRPDDIHMLICTHFDLDHCGHHPAFARAELIVQRQHYELARSGYSRLVASRPIWDHPDLHYRLVEGDVELLPGLDLIETHGHVPGHQSVLVRLPQTGPVLLTIDAVTKQSDFAPDRQPMPFDDDQEGERVQAGARKLIDIAEREHVALVIFGHDGQQWSALKRMPECYL